MFPPGPAPCGTAVRGGALWVGVYEAGRLLRLDASTGKTTRKIAVGRWACRVALDGKHAWVTRDRAGLLVRVDLATGRRHSLEVGASPFDVVVTGGSVWVTSFDSGTVARFDTATARLIRVYKDGPNPAGITSCAGRVWVGHGRESTWLTAIDPRTQRRAARRHGREESGLAALHPRGALGDDLRLRAASRRHATEKSSDACDSAGRPPKRPPGRTASSGSPTRSARSSTASIPTRVALVDSFPAGPGAYSLARVVRRDVGHELRRRRRPPLHAVAES